jgi:hypothetical protein
MMSIFGGLFTRDDPITELSGELQPLGSKALLVPCGRIVLLGLGPREVALRCEQGRGTSAAGTAPCWLLEEPVREVAPLQGFIRLHPGETMLLGRANDGVQRLFDLPRSMPNRHVELLNDQGTLIIRNLAPDHPSTLALGREEDPTAERRARRLALLARLSDVYGGPLQPLEPDDALVSAQAVRDLLRDESYRPRDSRGLPGGLLELPASRVPIILGDLHAKLDNLLRILCEDGCLDALERGDAYLLLLGDTVHREGDSELEEMDSSLLMLDFLCRLKLRFPDGFFWLRGNHESFDEDVGKGGVPQGMLLRRSLRERRGEVYVEALADLFDCLPYVARSDDFVACHAGAPRGAVSMTELVDIHEHPNLARELRWVRPQQTFRPAGFGSRDVARLRAALAVAKDAAVIVGHTPQTEDGVLWMDAGGIPGLHVIYSARDLAVPVFTRLRGGMAPLDYPPEPLLALAAASATH